MLKSLHIRDYVLIERLDVAFEAGLNVITGETGAGKSILVGALKLLLGDRASSDVVRAGARKAIVEARFDVSGLDGTRAIVRECGFDDLSELIIRREVGAGSSRAFVNDSPARLDILRQVSESLVDLHGQHDQQSLLKPTVHRDVVDAFGGHSQDVAAVATAYSRWRSAEAHRREVEDRAAALTDKAELYAFQKQEIDDVDPGPAEEEALDAERSRLSNAARLREEATGIHETLYTNSNSVYDQLSDAVDALDHLVRLDDELGELSAELRSALISVKEVAGTLREYAEDVEDNPERLHELDERLGAFESLKRRYGGSIEAVLQYRTEIEAVPTVEGLREEAAEAVRAAARAREALESAAAKLTQCRTGTSRTMEPLVVEKLGRLGMDKSQFEVRRAERPAGIDQSGADEIEFFIAPNAGEPLRPLARSASGGEISRIMLALKAIVAGRALVPVLVFDEIDVGISGLVAQRVGEEMHGLGARHQVIAITHLPQIAALGDAHFYVEKHEADGRTRTDLRALTVEERAAQIAQLISGARVTDTALANARDLISSAADRRPERH